MNPGQIALTRMPPLTYDRAVDLVICRIAPLLAWYAM